MEAILSRPQCDQGCIPGVVLGYYYQDINSNFSLDNNITLNSLSRFRYHRGNDDITGTALWPYYDDVIKRNHFPRYWPFVRGIHWSPVNSPQKGQ